jgi:hypothetical protein
MWAVQLSTHRRRLIIGPPPRLNETDTCQHPREELHDSGNSPDLKSPKRRNNALQIIAGKNQRKCGNVHSVIPGIPIVATLVLHRRAPLSMMN